MKIKKIIKFIVFMFTVLIVMNVTPKKVIANSNYPDIPNFNGETGYMINYDIYKKYTNLWCIQEGSHLTSYHTCVYKEYGSEQTIDVTNETDENKIALAKAAMEYSSFTGEKLHSTEEATMQYFAKKVGFGGNYYNSGNSDKFLDYAKIIKKLNDLKNKSTTLNATGKDGTYEVSFDEFSGLNSDEFKLTPSVVSGSGDVSIDPDGVINSNGKSATITIKNVPTGTKELKIKFSCKINGPTKLKYKTIKLAECTNSPDHKGLAPEPASVVARWGEVKGKLESAGCTKRESAGYELWNCGCPGQASMFVGDGPLNTLNLNVHNCVYHHYLNHINDWSINEQNLAMYYIEEGELEFEFEITITLEDTPTPEIEIEVIKKWKGSADKFPVIKFELKADNVTISTVIIQGNGREMFKNPSTGTTKFPKEKDGKEIKYTVTEDPSSGKVEKGSDTLNWSVDGSPSQDVPTDGGTKRIVTFINKIDEKEPDEPDTPSEDEDVRITKTVEYVLSEYEGDTSKEDGAGEGSKSARVQTGDQVVFKIVVESLRKDEPEDKEAGEEGSWEDDEEVKNGVSKTTEIANQKECSYTTCPDGHGGELYTSWDENEYFDTGDCKADGCGKPLGVRQVKSYGFKSLILEDVLEDESKVKINSVFDGTYDHGSVSGFTKPEGSWSITGNTFNWESGIGDEEAGKKSATLYILCDVSEDWKYDDGKGNECVNTATLKHVDWRITKTRWYHWQKNTTPYTCEHTRIDPHYHYKDCIACGGDGEVTWGNICTVCYGRLDNCWRCHGSGWVLESKPCSNCNGSGKTIERIDVYCTGGTVNAGTTTISHGKTDLPTKYEDEGKDYDISDTAKVILQGYNPGIEKRLIRIDSKYETAIEAKSGDDLSNELVQTGDVLTYAINVKNDGKTNIYTIFEIEDTMEEGLDTGTTTHIAVTNSGWDGSDPTYKTEQLDGKNNSVQNGGRYIGEGEKSDDLNFMAHVSGEPGEHTKNTAYLRAFHNRNKVKFKTDEQDSAENDIDTYSISVNKYITKVKSRQENSVAGSDGSGLVDLGDSRKTNKGEAVIVDRGDIVTFKIEITDDHDNTNIWKVELEDVYNPEELALKEYRSEDGLFEVNGSGGNIKLIYNNNPKNEPNTSNPHLEAGGGVRSVEIDFVAIEGAELLKKDDVYENKVNIEKAFNRNHIEILQYSSTGGTHESSDKCTVRQINAVIDKYVSKVFGGIEDVVYNNESRKRTADTMAVYTSRENFKEQANVPVERGDEITYTFKIRNTGEGIITVMKLEDIFDKELIFNKFTGESGWSCDTAVTAYNDKQNKLNITYKGLLNPGDEATLKLIFVMTNEEDDKYDLYGRNYINTLKTTEIQNINSWTWNNAGGPNTPYTSVIDNYIKNQCYLNLLQNGEGGIPSNMESSDYVYMLEYKVELDKYVINVKHTNDDGSEENYNNPGRKHYENGKEKDYDNVVAWEGKDDADTNRENWNDETKIAKSVNKKQYPVQVEKNDIVTYEIKIKNTNDESIPGDTSIYALEIADIFSSEDGSDKTTNKITDNNIGLELMVNETKAENNNQLEILSTSSDKNQYLFKFTPKGQCSNSGKSTNGYGIGVNEVATFRIVVKVTRSNMYLYELRNTAVITSVYNRNNNIGNNDQDKQYKYSSTDTNRIVNDAYRVTNGNRAYILQNGSIVEQLTLNGLSKISKINEITLASEITVANKIADADYINLKDLIISGYVWDDTDPNNEEDGLMTWGAAGSTDVKVDGDVTVYLYRVKPEDTTETDLKGKLVMSTTVADDGYYIFDNNSEVYSKKNKPYLFEEENADKKFYDDSNSITVKQKYRFEPINYIRPTIQVKVKNEEQIIKGQIIKGQDDEKKALTNQIYSDGFTNYRIVKAPNKDYDNGTARYNYDSNKETKYYQYYVEFEYNGMKYTHTVYGSDTTLEENKVKGETENRTKTNSNQDGQYNLTERDKNNSSERWLPYRKFHAEDIKNIEKYNSEYYEIDSNAAEFKSVRESFNNQFSEIAYNRGLDKNNNETSIKYNEGQNTHIDRYDEAQDNVKIRARSFITNWIDKVGPEINNDDSTKTYRNDLYKKFSATIGDYTNTLFFWDSKNTIRKGNDISNYTNTVGTTEETEYLKYINLGLKRRPEFDMELVKDVYNVQVDINDKTMVYDYNCIIPLDRADETAETSKYFTTGYELNLYKSDYYYRYTDYSNETVQKYKETIEPNNSELKEKSAGDWLNKLGFDIEKEKSKSALNLQITYRYRITNTSRNKVENGNELIIGTVNEIIDYHSADLIPNETGRYEKIIADNNKKYSKEQAGELTVSTGYKKEGYRTVNEKNVYVTENKEKQDNINAVYLTGLENVLLYPSDSVDIYLTFTVSRNSTTFEKVVDSENKEVVAMQLGTKNNVAEISAFSTKYDANDTTNWSKLLDTPGLVDKDSNPGDLAIGDINNYDIYNDDTYKVDIKTQFYNDDDGNNDGERLIDGLVWEDVKINEKGVYELNNPAKIIYQTMQVVADGKYDLGMTSRDKFIQKLKVELIELINVDGVVYEDRAEVIGSSDIVINNEKLKQRLLSTKTDASGKYTISGFIPGNYVVRFTYGDTCDTIDEGYNGQDYKSTSYQVGISDNKDGNNYIANTWHDLLSQDVNKVKPKEEYTYTNEYGEDKNEYDEKATFNIAKKDDDSGADEHLSDARDDEVRRLEVSAYSRTINNKVAEVLNSAIADGHSTGLHDELRKNTWMFADTAKLQIEVEHINNTKEYTKQKIKSSKYNKDTKSYYENLYYEIEAQAKKLTTKDNKGKETIEIKNKKIPYYIGNIDFGLEARPTTNISLTKLVSGIRVETADGEEILDVEYEPQYSENGTLLLNDNGVPKVDNTITTGAEHMQALNSSTTDIWGNTADRNAENQNGEKANVVKQMYRNLKTTQGFYYINIDEDLMQGAVITLRYSIVVANESEVDTLGMLTGFGNGEQIYDEVVAILENDGSKSSYKFNEASLSDNYKYVEAKAESEIPTYKDNKITENNIGDLKYGYYTGATYYSGDYHEDTYVVETRIDQIIDYVDNNLNVREEDNSTKDSSWRTVSLKELVEGEIQKDVVGQENSNNKYSKTLDKNTLKYVAYGSNETKTIEVSNVGNMLSDKVYRTELDSNVEDKNLENELKNASVDNDTIKDKKGEKIVTILDSNAREYITAQRNNILLSIPETDKNPDLYKYLIPAKALTAKPNIIDGTAVAIEIKVDEITDEKINNENTSNEVKGAMKELIKKFKERENLVMYPATLEGLKNYINAYMVDENFNGDEKIYEIAEGKLLKLAQETIATELSKYVYGTQNGEREIYKDDKIKGYEKKNGDTSAKIKITATRTISPESTAEEREDLTFENLAEILQFSNEAGRRDEFATVGDAQVWEGAWKASTGYTPQGGIPKDSTDGGEDGGNTETNESVTNTKTKERYDTDTTEMVLLSPPTGLSQRELVELGTVKTQNNILLISVLTLTMTATIIIVIKISNRKKFYR